ncbi:MAG TPA: flagellin [Chloroflexota bacterium]|nr:flagellin [Chloroflexota bacterium]
MSVRINTNIDALEAQRNLGLVSMDFSKAVQQLSSGLRINSAADDAAGLAISQKLQTQVKGFDQGARNAQDAISMVQTGESALGTTQSMLQRMRQLAVQAANDTYTDQDRHNIQAEINQLISEIDRISQQTDFNTKKLLDGSAGGGQAVGGGPNIKGLVIQAGVAIATQFSITAASAATKSALEAASAQGSFFTQNSSITISGATGTETFTAHVGESLEEFFQVVNNSGIGVTMGVDQNTTTGAVQIVNNYFGINTSTGLVLTGPTAVTVVDNGVTYPQGTVFTGGPEAVTVANATGDFSTSGLCMQFTTAGKQGSISSTGTFQTVEASNATITISTIGGSSLMTATGLNSDQISGTGLAAGIVITLQSPGVVSTGDVFKVVQNNALQFQVGANANQEVAIEIDAANSQTLGVGSLSVLTQTDAETAITQLDRSIQSVSASRSNMGAIINRLTNSLTNDQLAQENASASNSRIEDVNMAQETVQFTRDQILMQAGTSILAQANQAPTSILSLLR